MTESARDSPLWLSHHWPEHHDRCLHIGRHLVCRRCSVLYPLAALTAVLVALVEVSEPLLIAAMWLLPAPMAIEWTLEQLGRVRYSAQRQIALTAIGAPALGVALGLHAQRPFSIDAIAPVAFWLLVCGTAWGVTTLRSTSPQVEWETRHEADEAARRERLAQLLEPDDQLPSSR